MRIYEFRIVLIMNYECAKEKFCKINVPYNILVRNYIYVSHDLRKV
jgi:hypothetical protein